MARRRVCPWCPLNCFSAQVKGTAMVGTILGLPDPWIALVYLLCIGSTLLCVVYSYLNWNKGDDAPKAEDVEWAKHEEEVAKHLTE
jgi:hypothetical protein